MDDGFDHRLLEGAGRAYEAACVGVPDARKITGEAVCAYLVLAAGGTRAADAELSQWVAARLEPYKVPTQYRWIAALPRTASGKLVRKALRDEVKWKI